LTGAGEPDRPAAFCGGIDGHILGTDDPGLMCWLRTYAGQVSLVSAIWPDGADCGCGQGAGLGMLARFALAAGLTRWSGTIMQILVNIPLFS